MSENREIAIQIEGLKKRYRLGTIGGGTLVGDIQSWWARVRKKEDPTLKIGAKKHDKHETFMALDGIDLTIYKGERIGIIGHNGAGKSTLLKLLSRVTGPTEGELRMNGRVSSMLEVGTGFNGELTGRENIYINGAILGMTKAEIDAKMDQIIEFSECKQFIDTPVKRYSSGMYVKLAFSVAAHLDSEILIMDEVLAVGDMQFQRKCLNKMSDVSKEEGRTILYVSHNMNTIRQLCERCIVLSKGKIIFNGDVEEAIARYLGEESISETKVDLSKISRKGFKTDKRIELKQVELCGKDFARYRFGEVLEMKVDYTAKDIKEFDIRISIYAEDERVIGMATTNKRILCNEGMNSTNLFLSPQGLAPGKYLLRMVAYSVDEFGRTFTHDVAHKAVVFGIDEIGDEVNKIEWVQAYWGAINFPTISIK